MGSSAPRAQLGLGDLVDDFSVLRGITRETQEMLGGVEIAGHDFALLRRRYVAVERDRADCRGRRAERRVHLGAGGAGRERLVDDGGGITLARGAGCGICDDSGASASTLVVCGPAIIALYVAWAQAFCSFACACVNPNMLSVTSPDGPCCRPSSAPGSTRVAVSSAPSTAVIGNRPWRT